MLIVYVLLCNICNKTLKLYVLSEIYEANNSLRELIFSFFDFFCNIVTSAFLQSKFKSTRRINLDLTAMQKPYFREIVKKIIFINHFSYSKLQPKNTYIL